MIVILILSLISLLTTAYGMYTAPFMDDKGRVTKPGKKLTDLFK
jgi:hypothetical protein